MTDFASVAAELAPMVTAAREETEANRRTPPHVVEALARAGLLQLYLPRSLGGPELPPLDAFFAIEELSRADGSVGWCAMIATVVSQVVGWIEPGTAKSVAGAPADLRGAGSLRPLGLAREVDGGYRVSGHWNFASGIGYANWLYCNCRVMHGDTPRLTAEGTPVLRAAWIPRSAANVIDTWSVVGLRGTGSNDFVVDDLFVAREHTTSITDPPFERGRLYDRRLFFVTLWTVTAANALGIARGAIDAFTALAAQSSTSSPIPLRDRLAAQASLAEAEAILSAARAFAINAVGSAWETAADADPSLAIARARLAITHSIHEAVRATDLVFHAAGTNAIYTRNALERHWRDIHTVVQHNAAFQSHYASAGKVLLGLRPSDPGW